MTIGKWDVATERLGDGVGPATGDDRAEARGIREKFADGPALVETELRGSSPHREDRRDEPPRQGAQIRGGFRWYVAAE